MQWKDFPYDASTWQPEANLTADVIGEYDSPAVTAAQLASGITVLRSALCGFLRHRGVVVHPVSVDLHLDVFRAMTSRCQPLPSPCVRGYMSYTEDDCDTIGLPEGWKYLVNRDGVGRKLAFPILVKQSAHFSQLNFKRTAGGDLEELPRHPCEKLTIRCATQACSI